MATRQGGELTLRKRGHGEGKQRRVKGTAGAGAHRPSKAPLYHGAGAFTGSLQPKSPGKCCFEGSVSWCNGLSSHL